MHVSDPSTARSRVTRLARLTACGAVALAATGVVTAAASAASITVPAACVLVDPDSVQPSAMVVTGHGFGPNDLIELTTNTGNGLGTATADATGAFTVTIGAPLLPKSGPDEAAFVLSALDQTDDVTTASVNFLAANLAVSANPSRAKPGKKVNFSFSGLTGGADIYAHYLHGKKVVMTEKLGRATGPCGLLKTRATLFPRHAKFKNYRIQYDNSRRYAKTTLPSLIAMLTTESF